MTLELGIDIGELQSVVQVNPPPSVSSLRQRLGRTGRRDGVSILRMLISEDDLSKSSSPNDKLRLELVQSLAMIRLLIGDKWFEPADTDNLHLSTLVHQILATVAQWGGVLADQLYSLLCRQGPFTKIKPAQFMSLLRHLGTNECITQLGSGELVLGIEGERLVNQHTFYAVFKTPDEYRVVNGSKTIGQLPVDSMILPNQSIVFAGRRWKVLDVDNKSKVIHVKKTKGGKPPKFGGESMRIHDVVREEMFRIYESGDYRIDTHGGKMDFIDDEAKELFKEGLQFFRDADLSITPFLQQDNNVCILPWCGDKVANTLAAILMREGFQAGNYAGVIEVQKMSIQEITDRFKMVLSSGMPTEYELANMLPEKHVEKFDELLPDELLTEGFGLRMFDVAGAKKWLETNIG
jgi:ATP-dependent Lhr-like helicase